MEIEILKLEYDCGDKRSYGRLEVEARTPHGVLSFEGNIASDSTLDDVLVKLDGKETPDELDAPDPGLPHWYAPSALKRRVDEKAQVREAVEEWCKAYSEWLEEQGEPAAAP